MTADCPKCRKHSLRSYKERQVDSTHVTRPPPLRCEICRGVWLPVRELERWKKVKTELETQIPRSVAIQEADKRTGLCPMKHGLLERGAPVETRGETFRLERCPHCGGMWFDPGEWNRLVRGELLESLEKFWDPLYRRQRRKQEALESREDLLRRMLGPETYEKMDDLIDILTDHPMRSVAIAHMAEKLGTIGDSRVAEED